MLVIWFSLVLAGVSYGQIRSVEGRATVYWTDNAGKHRAVCRGVDPRTKKIPCERCFFDRQRHIAHRTLPLGTRGVVCNSRTNLCTRTRVMDRGPYGAIIPCEKYKEDTRVGFPIKRLRVKSRCFCYQVQIKLLPGWKRRGQFDLTRPVAKDIKHRPFDRVIFFYKS